MFLCTWRFSFACRTKSALKTFLVSCILSPQRKIKMSEHQRKIYQNDGDRYEALIAREDYKGNILQALDEIVRVEGLDVLDLGAGTGRLAVMLAPRTRSMKAFDMSEEMLRIC